MPHIVIEQPGVPSMRVEIDSAEIVIVRADGNHIGLVSDEVSRNHAKIRLLGDKTVLHDLKSLNGTYVNRQRIVERVLADNDEIWFGGKCRAMFHEDSKEVLQQRAGEKGAGTALAKDLNEIREEMDRVTSNMTMMGGMGLGKKTVTGEVDADKNQQVEIEKLRRAFRRLDALYKATKLITSEFDLQKRLTDVLDLAMDVTNAGRGFIMLREEGTETLTLRVARGMGGQELGGSSPSMGIARSAAIVSRPIDPQPITNAVSSLVRVTCSAPCRAQANGSHKTAASSEKSSGTRNT
ncbi:MAG: FHA domain-containing protein [Planctomycetes bacterium]|nr:FHA domain-containing protein [Planctomycetota bacterium]